MTGLQSPPPALRATSPVKGEVFTGGHMGPPLRDTLSHPFCIPAFCLLHYYSPVSTQPSSTTLANWTSTTVPVGAVSLGATLWLAAVVVLA